MDHFTRFTQAFITPNETAPVVARTLWDQYFMKYGIPEKIISDQGRNFESKLIAELCNLARIQKLYTSPYRPQTNGKCECFNSTLISMIGTLPPDMKRNWQAQIATLEQMSDPIIGEVRKHLTVRNHLLLDINHTP